MWNDFFWLLVTISTIAAKPVSTVVLRLYVALRTCSTTPPPCGTWPMIVAPFFGSLLVLVLLHTVGLSDYFSPSASLFSSLANQTKPYPQLDPVIDAKASTRLVSITMFQQQKNSQQQQQQWQIAHLASHEPEAAQYLEDHDDWDASTVASTPSIQRGYSFATILRDGGEPSHIILSVEHKLSMSKRALKKLVNAIKALLDRLGAKRRFMSSGISNANSTVQPSLGVMGVLV